MTTSPKAIHKESDNKIIRVAFYDRNRVTHDTPISVIELQNAVFRHLLQAHPEWKNVGIYRDIDELGEMPGNHMEYDRLVNDCIKGMIDLVVTKSICKFSRSIDDCIKKVSVFHSLNPPVDIYFINENIDTRKPDNLALFINMYSLINESEKSSGNAKEPIKTRYASEKYDSSGTKKKSRIHSRHRRRGRK